MRHILEVKTGKKTITNYLDNFLFLAYLKSICNQMIRSFLDLCKRINIPVSEEKTEWADTVIIFLGILLNGKSLTLSIPLEKRIKALNLLNEMSSRKKATVKQLQVLTGYLNFLTKAIVLGRTFTRCMYAKYAQLGAKGNKVQNLTVVNKLKSHHHVPLDGEFHFDCEVWRVFLDNYQDCAVCHPMIDLSKTVNTQQLRFTSDASANAEYGIGATFENRWLFGQWEPGYIKNNEPSIEYLELLGVTAALLTWGHLIKNKRVEIFYNNMAVVCMINNYASSCSNCMYLLRIITLNN